MTDRDAESAAGRTRRLKRCPDPSEAVAKQLYGLASRCGAPECNEPFVKLVDGRRTLNSRIAHIRASGPTGPRADAFMTCEEVNDFDNLIVLCLFHAVEIDEHEDSFPVALLEEWKARQLAESAVLNTPVSLTNQELREAVTAIERGSISTDAIREFAVAARRLRTLAERSSERPMGVTREFARRVEELNLSMPVMWNSQTGERIKPAAQLSVAEERGFHEQLRQALDQAVADVQPLADHVLELGAGLGAIGPIPPEALLWLERTLQSVISECGRRPNRSDPSAPLVAALHEVDVVVEAFASLFRGEQVAIPESPAAALVPEPSELDRFIASYRAEYDAALRFTRVKHLEAVVKVLPARLLL